MKKKDKNSKASIRNYCCYYVNQHLHLYRPKAIDSELKNACTLVLELTTTTKNVEF